MVDECKASKERFVCHRSAVAPVGSTGGTKKGGKFNLLPSFFLYGKRQFSRSFKTEQCVSGTIDMRCPSSFIISSHATLQRSPTQFPNTCHSKFFHKSLINHFVVVSHAPHICVTDSYASQLFISSREAIFAPHPFSGENEKNRSPSLLTAGYK